MVLLWLWRRLAAIAPIRLLAWEPPYASSVALEKTKKKKKSERAREMRFQGGGRGSGMDWKFGVSRTKLLTFRMDRQ